MGTAAGGPAVMRVGLDARGLNTQFVRGMGEYLNMLIAEVGRRHEIAWHCYGNRPDLPFHRPPGGEIVRVALTDIRGHRFHSWEQLALPLAARRDRLDLLHCTMTTLPVWQPVPTIVTIHDTIQWNTGEDMAPGFYRDRLIPRAYANCRAIITISDSSRRDILRHWPRLADKLHVIHHGIDDTYLTGDAGSASATLRQVAGDRPYLLFVGGAAPRKRLGWTIELFQELGRADIALAAVGVPGAAHESFRAAIPPAWRDNVAFLPFVPETEMPALYQNALAVLYPTLYEGFGLPAVKAQAVGTPILLSAVGSLAELVGPTTIVLPTDDRGAWREACRATVERRLAGPAPDPASRLWARQFSLDRTAEAHWQVYRQAAGWIGG